INVDNVQTLQRAWTFHTGDKTGFFESTPLVVSDVMYVSAQNGVFALDPATGAQRWKVETLGKLWATKLDAPAHSIPSTYMGKDGKQYVVIAAGGGGFLQSPLSDEVIAFRLP